MEFCISSNWFYLPTIIWTNDYPTYLQSFSYYEKPTVINVMVQKRLAMEENSRTQILSNDLRRRLSNTDPRQGKKEHIRVGDMFAKKILTS